MKDASPATTTDISFEAQGALLTERAQALGFESIHIKANPDTQFKAIIAIHNTQNGPAIGGCRYIHYNAHQQAFDDVLRLAKGMTYKAAVHGLPHGGAKAVLIKPQGISPEQERELFIEYASFVNDFKGQYITSIDSGTHVAHMDILAQHTPYVLGQVMPDPAIQSDPSPMTALGVMRAMQATMAHLYGDSSLQGRHIALQGVGQVGSALARLLKAEGAQLTVADQNQEKVKRLADELDIAWVDPAEIHAIACDIFSPCALGAILHAESIPNIQAKAIVGAANNQLHQSEHADTLQARGILYVPDVVASGGGLIHVAQIYAGHNMQASYDAVDRIYERTRLLLSQAKQAQITPWAAVEQLVQARLNQPAQAAHADCYA